MTGASFGWDSRIPAMSTRSSRVFANSGSSIARPMAVMPSTSWSWTSTRDRSFLRRERSLDVYRDNKTGELRYVGRAAPATQPERDEP